MYSALTHYFASMQSKYLTISRRDVGLSHHYRGINVKKNVLATFKRRRTFDEKACGAALSLSRHPLNPFKAQPDLRMSLLLERITQVEVSINRVGRLNVINGDKMNESGLVGRLGHFGRLFRFMCSIFPYVRDYGWSRDPLSIITGIQ